VSIFETRTGRPVTPQLPAQALDHPKVAAAWARYQRATAARSAAGERLRALEGDQKAARPIEAAKDSRAAAELATSTARAELSDALLAAREELASRFSAAADVASERYREAVAELLAAREAREEAKAGERWIANVETQSLFRPRARPVVGVRGSEETPWARVADALQADAADAPAESPRHVVVAA
jgi:hypothetical protein